VDAPSKPGLRERKKRQTHRRIVEVARHLFAARGYDATSISDIAEGVDISVSTVFGYFPNKAEIFFAGYDEIIDEFVRAITERPEGQSAIEATVGWHEGLRARRALLGPDAPEAQWSKVARRLADTEAALHAIERERYAPAEAALAQAVADDLGDDPAALRPQLIAATKVALMFTLSRHESRTHGDGTDLGPYVDSCLRAAASAIAEVPSPGRQLHTASW
jgi:AcrR family transcriptional regulator